MRAPRILLCLLVALPLLTLPVAAESSALPTVEQALPSQVCDYVDAETVDRLGQGRYGIKEVLHALLSHFATGFPTVSASFCTLFGALLLFCALRALQKKESAQSSFSEYVCMLCFVLPTTSLLFSLWETVEAAIGSLHTVMTAMTPTVTALLLLGGNAQGAAVQGSMLALVLGSMETVLHSILAPLFSVLLGVSILGGVCMDSAFSQLVTLLRKGFSWLVTFFFGLFALVLGYQTTIAAGADSLGARTLKFTVGSTVPLVGGALGESVRTLAGSLSVLRGTVGAVGIVCVLGILLPPIVLLVEYQLLFGVLGFCASLLDCPRQGDFFRRMQELVKFAWTLMVASGLFFILLLTVFSKSVAAYAA